MTTIKMLGIASSLSIVLCNGCLEVDPLIQGAPSKEQSAMQSGCYLGSAYWDGPYCCEWAFGGDQDHTLYSVRPKYNYWYAWTTVLTFGLVMPIDLEWKYNKD